MIPLAIPETTVLFLRLFLAGVLGGAIGLERVWHGRPAGLRTNMIIAISSCLFTIISAYGFGAQEPTRIASQIVVGVGFLGAGTMLHNQKQVLGLTTASTIWLVAALGMAVGAGMYLVAAFVTAVALFFLAFLAPISTWLEHHAERNARSQGVTIVHLDHRVHYVSSPHRHPRRKPRAADPMTAKD